MKANISIIAKLNHKNMQKYSITELTSAHYIYSLKHLYIAHLP